MSRVINFFYFIFGIYFWFYYVVGLCGAIMWCDLEGVRFSGCAFGETVSDRTCAFGDALLVVRL